MSASTSRVRARPDASPYTFEPLNVTAAAHSRTASGAPEDPVEGGDSAEEVARAIETAVQEARAETAAEIQRLEAALADAEQAAEDAIAQADASSEKIKESTDRLTALWMESVQGLETHLVELAVGVAEGVAGAPLADAARAAAERAIAEAVDQLANDCPVTISLHPVDLLYLQESGFASTLSGAHAMLRWEPDTSLGPGDWTASTSEAAVRRVAADMFGGLRDRLGIHGALTR